jgi:hypothetical protein
MRYPDTENLNPETQLLCCNFNTNGRKRQAQILQGKLIAQLGYEGV